MLNTLQSVGAETLKYRIANVPEDTKRQLTEEP
jgi:hypothetical protein